MIQGKSQIILFKIFLRVASEKSFLVFPEFNFSRNVSKATIFSQIRNFSPQLWLSRLRVFHASSKSNSIELN